MQDEEFEYLMSMLPAEPDKTCALHLLPRALDFVRGRDTEFGTVDIQKHLKAGYGKVVKVIDAMIALCVIEVTEEKPRKYKRICEKDEINHDIYYNGWMRDADTEYSSGWDPSLFRTREEALNYAKAAYGDWVDYKDPVYVIEKIQVGNGWNAINREEFRENEI
jgi:hypothetical protein